MPLALSALKLNCYKSSRATVHSSVVVSTEIRAFALIVGYPEVLLTKLIFKMQIPDSTGGCLVPKPSWSYSRSLPDSQFNPGSSQSIFVKGRLGTRICTEHCVEHK